jgi:hypothetical protein
VIWAAIAAWSRTSVLLQVPRSTRAAIAQADLERRRKGDAQKVAVAWRLRKRDDDELKLDRPTAGDGHLDEYSFVWVKKEKRTQNTIRILRRIGLQAHFIVFWARTLRLV